MRSRVENRFPSQPTQPFVQAPARAKPTGFPWRIGGAAVALLTLVSLGVVLWGVDGEERAPVEVEAAVVSDVSEQELGPGWVTVRSDTEGVRVFVGEREIGQTPIDQVELPVGETTLRWVAGGGQEAERTISVLPNRTARIFLESEASP